MGEKKQLGSYFLPALAMFAWEKLIMKPKSIKSFGIGEKNKPDMDMSETDVYNFTLENLIDIEEDYAVSNIYPLDDLEELQMDIQDMQNAYESNLYSLVDTEDPSQESLDVINAFTSSYDDIQEVIDGNLTLEELIADYTEMI